MHNVFLQLVGLSEDPNKRYMLPTVDNVSEISLNL